MVKDLVKDHAPAEAIGSSEFLTPQALLQPPEYFSGTGELSNRNVDSAIVLGKWLVISGDKVCAIDSSGQILPLPSTIDTSPLPGKKAILTQALADGKEYITFVDPTTSTWSRDTNLYVYELIRKINPSISDKDIQMVVKGIIEELNRDGVDTNKSLYASAREIRSIVHAITDDSNDPSKIFTIDEKSFAMVRPAAEPIKILANENIADWKTESVKPVERSSSIISEVMMSNGLKIRRMDDGRFSRVVNDKNTQLMVIPDPNVALDNEDGSTIWYTDGGKVCSLDTKKLASGSFEPTTTELPPELTGCSRVDLDPSGNFLIVTHGERDNQSITILNKKSLEKIETFTGVQGSTSVDQNGNVIYIDNNKQLRIIVTNFSKFPAGYGSQIAEAQQAQAAKLAAAIEGLELPEVSSTSVATANGKGDAKTIDEVLPQLQAKLNSLFGPSIDNAVTDADIEKLKLQLNAIKAKPEFAQYSAVSSAIERAMDIKSAQLKAQKLDTGLASLGNQIPTIESLEGSLSLVKEMERLKEIRTQINTLLLEPEFSKALLQRLKEIEGKVGIVQQKYQGELVGQLQSNLQSVGEILGSAGSAMEFEEVLNDPSIRQYVERLNLVSDPKQRASLREGWHKLLEAKQQAIAKARGSIGEDQRARAAEIASDIEVSFRRLSTTVSALLKETEGKVNLTAWEAGSQSVDDLRQQINRLPEAYRGEYERRIQEIILQKQTEYRQRHATESRVAQPQGATIKVGEESFPVYQKPLVNVTPAWIPRGEGKSKTDIGELVFQSTTGEVWRTGATMPMNIDDKHRQQRFEELRKIAEQRFNPKRRVPEIPAEMVLTPSQEKTLENMARLFRRQLGLNKNLVRERKPRGITIMQGDAGVGKDFSIEVLASMTNREVVSVPCRFSMDPEDVTSEYRFNPKKGTFRVPSQFAQALQRPGTIVNFIEINTMPPEVAKMLNSVFDFKRTLYFTQGTDPDSVEINTDGIGQEIKVNEDVVFVGTMNPENYIGTRPLPQEFKSRARFLDVDYPPYRVAKNSSGKQERLPVEQTSTPSGLTDMKISSDEAMILAKQVDSLRSLTPDEFARLWDHKINRVAGNGADVFDNTDRTAAINSLNQVVKIANKMRQAYRAFQTNEPGAEVFEFVFSLRESQDIVAELAEKASVKEAVAEVILPKISDPEQRKKAQNIIDTA